MGGGSSKKPVEPPAANESGGSGGSGKKKKKGKGKKKGKDGGGDPAVSTGAGQGDDPGGAIRVESLPLEDEGDIERDAAADLPVESRGDRRRGSSTRFVFFFCFFAFFGGSVAMVCLIDSWSSPLVSEQAPWGRRWAWEWQAEWWTGKRSPQQRSP